MVVVATLLMLLRRAFPTGLFRFESMLPAERFRFLTNSQRVARLRCSSVRHKRYIHYRTITE